MRCDKINRSACIYAPLYPDLVLESGGEQSQSHHFSPLSNNDNGPLTSEPDPESSSPPPSPPSSPSILSTPSPPSTPTPSEPPNSPTPSPPPPTTVPSTRPTCPFI